MRREQCEVWWRDPVECVAELIGNPAFRHAMRYAPEKLYEDVQETIEVVNEMWTASWWWEIQVSGINTMCDEFELMYTIRNDSLLGLLSHRLSCPPTKPCSRTSVATTQLGLFILLLGISAKKLAVKCPRMRQS
jgi:hypothetical protein